MATKLPIDQYCDSLYAELYNMKSRLVEFVMEIEHMEGKERSLLNPFTRHLNELIKAIDWKLEIFTKVCPVDWSKYFKGVETTVSVSTETLKESEQPGGGFLGG